MNVSLISIFPFFTGTRPDIPANISSELYADTLALFHACTETMPAMRPSAELVHAAAKNMLDKYHND